MLPPGCATQATCPTSLSLFSCLRSEALLAVTRPPVPSTGRAPARAGLLMAVTRVDTPTTWQGGISREAKRLRWYSFLSHAAARMQPGTSKLCSLKPVRTRQHGEGPCLFNAATAAGFPCAPVWKRAWVTSALSLVLR